MIGQLAAFISSVQAAITTAATYAKIALTVYAVGTGVKGYYKHKELLAKGQQVLGQKVASGGKIGVIYGRRRVGSTVALMHTHDGRSQNLVVVYALSVGEVDQIELDTIQINGVSIKDTKVFHQGYYAGSDKISSGAGSLCTASQIGVVQESNAGQSGTDPTRRYRMVFNAHHGASDQTADPMLIASTPEVWSSNHRLRGIAYIAASFEYDTEGMFRGIPELTVCVRGRKLYDPRKDGSISGGTGSHRIDDTSTYEWSDNPALTLLDYMTNDEYGKGLAASDINLQSFQTSANNADTLEDTPDYNGSYDNATFSGTSGTNIINVDETTWKRAKSGVFKLRDSSDVVEFDDVDIVDASRWHEFEATNPVYQIALNDTLSTNYTNEAGSALVKVKRFTCNGFLDPDQNVLENTKELLANMRGILNYIDGKYELTLEDTASSTFTVTDDHIIADSGITVSYEDKSEKANKVVVRFYNMLKKYEMDTVTLFHSATPNYKSDDGGEELELVVDFPYITNKYVAYNMGEAILARSRNQQTIAFTATPELYKVKVGDVITVSYTPLGYTGKLFRVEGMTLQPDGLISVQAVEYLDIYTWQAPPQESIEEISRVPNGREVKAPSGLAFTDTDSSSTGRAFLSWNEITDFPQYEFRVAIVDSSNNKVLNRIVSENFVDLTFLPVGSNYVASVTTINGQSAESSATTLIFSVGDEPVLTADIKDAAVTNTKINDMDASKITAGTVDTARLNVNDIISTGSIIVSGDNVTSLSNNAGYVNSSQAASAAPVQSVAGATGAVSAATIITAGSIVVQGDNISTLTNNSGFTDFDANDVQSAIDNNVTAIDGGKITTNTITAAKINVTDLALEFDAATVSGSTIGSWQNDTMRLLKVADIGTAAGVYHIMCRVFGSTGEVKTLSIVAGDGTYGSGSSYELRNDIEYTDGTSPTIPTADQGYAQYHSGQSQYWSAIDRFNGTNEMVQKDFLVRKISGTSRTLRLYILAQGNGSNRQLSNVQFGVYRFSEI